MRPPNRPRRHGVSGSAGVALTVGGISTVLARAPAGALVDSLRAKRTPIGAASVLVAVAAIAIALLPSFWPVMAAQAANGAADAVFPAAVAAISLGIVGRARFTARVGRNEAFNHAGNVITAVAAGIAGWLIGPGAVLWMAALLALGVLVPLARIHAEDIDQVLARGADDGDRGRSERDGLLVLARNRPLLAFTAAITLFHFANAAMLPLLGEKLSGANSRAGAPFVAACIITAQAVMVPMACWWGVAPMRGDASGCC